MRIDVNLATHKYHDARQFYVRWGSALALALAVTVALAFLAWRSYKNTVADTQRIRGLKAQISRLEEKKAEATRIRNLPVNQDVLDQSDFWNDVIDQKSFSWTQLFSDLEKIMPARAFVTHAEPAITPERRLQLQLVFVGEKYDDAIELFRNMEKSERFRAPELKRTEPHVIGSGASARPVVQFEIAAYYTPAAPGQQPQAAAGKGGLQ